MFKMILNALSDENGQVSSMRIVWSLVVLTIFGVWATICIKNNQLMSFEVGDATLIGMLFGGKIGQKYFEVKEATNGKK